MVKAYLATDPDPAMFEFLKDDFAALEAKHGGIVSTTFRNFPSFPQRYMERLEMPSADCSVRVEPLKPLTQPVLYTEDDLHVRQFTGSRTNRLSRKGRGQAA